MDSGIWLHFIVDPVSKIALCDRLAEYGRPFRGHFDCEMVALDTDTRRWLKITGRKAGDLVWDLELSSVEDQEFFQHAAPMFAAIRAEIDAGPPDLTALTVTVDGKTLCRSTDPYDDVTPGTHYAQLSEYHIPAHIKTLCRDELVEVRRLGAFVDVVVARKEKKEELIFKYYQHAGDLPATWNSIHIGAGIDHHPHILPIRHLVLDEIARDRVVGFTTPFIPGGALSETMGSRPFKLKYAKQLFHTLDDLHYKYGVTHGDDRGMNMLIDPATDNLVLIDFGLASKIGTPYSMWHLAAALSPDDFPTFPVAAITQDIRMAVQSVFYEVTGTLDQTTPGGHTIGIDMKTIKKKGSWVKSPHVLLDSPAHDYYRVTMDWLHERNTRPLITRHSDASQPLNYPNYMPTPQVDIDAFLAEKARSASEADAAAEKREAHRPTRKRQKTNKTIETKPTTSRKLRSSVLELQKPPPYHSLFPGRHFGRWWRNYMETGGHATGGRHFRRLNALEAGKTVLDWARPSTLTG